MKVEFISAPGPTPTPADWEALSPEGIPPGYRALIEQTGAGLLTGWLELLLPDRVVKELSDFRERLEDSWCWGETPPTAERASMVRLAETVNADELAWSPSSGYWLLPADEDEALGLGASFEDAIAGLFKVSRMPPIYVFMNESVVGDELSVEGKTVAEVSEWLSAHFGDAMRLHETTGELGPGAMALIPAQRMLVTVRTEDEDELLLECFGTESRAAALLKAVDRVFEG